MSKHLMLSTMRLNKCPINSSLLRHKVTPSHFYASAATTTSTSTLHASFRLNYDIVIESHIVSKEQDLELTMQLIMDHAARSSTTSEDQFISQMNEAKKNGA